MKLKITVHGVGYEVDVEVLDAGEGFFPSPLPPPPGPPASAPPVARPAAGPAARPAFSDAGRRVIESPLGGAVVEVKCKPGETVTQGQIVLVIEAMKMKTNIAAPAAGRVARVAVAAGDNVTEGQVLVELE